MATYTYECESCGSGVDVIRSMSDGPPGEVTCPECDGETRRIFQAPTIRYKGPGFTQSPNYTVPPGGD